MPLFDLWLMTTSRGRNRSTTYQLFSSLKSSERGHPISVGNTASSQWRISRRRSYRQRLLPKRRGKNLIKIDFLLIWHEMVVLPFVVTNVNWSQTTIRATLGKSRVTPKGAWEEELEEACTVVHALFWWQNLDQISQIIVFSLNKDGCWWQLLWVNRFFE